MATDNTALTDAQKASLVGLATAIRTKMYGKDVREAIASAIEMVGQPGVGNYFTPKGVVANLAALKKTYPNGTDGIWITSDDGYWCYWDGSAWQKGAQYQAATGIIKTAAQLYTAETLPSSFKDLDNFPTNEVVSYSGIMSGNFYNLPKNFTTDHVNASILSMQFQTSDGLTDNGASQFLMVQDSDSNSYMYFRTLSKNSNGIVTSDWVKVNDELDQKVTENSVQLNSSNISSPYTDLDTFPIGEIVSVSGDIGSLIRNSPSSLKSDSDTNSSVFTYGFYNSGKTADNGTTQFLTCKLSDGNAHMFFRISSKNSTGLHYSNWHEIDSGNDIKNYTVSNDSSEYIDVNNVLDNSMLIYLTGSLTKNAPTQSSDYGVGTLLAYNPQLNDSMRSGQVQIWTDSLGNSWIRSLWGTSEGTRFNSWRRITAKDVEGASISAYQKIGVIGDSYASGSINGNDNMQVSWPQILGRSSGTNVTNFTHGGAQTSSWLQSSNYGLAALQSADSQDMYICALGINDAVLYTKNSDYLGSKSDIGDTSKQTFYSYYSQIVVALKKKNQYATIIMLGIPYNAMDMSVYTEINNAIENIANYYDIPYINLANDPFFLDTFFAGGLVSSHPTFPVYAGMARRIKQLIEECMVSNRDYFASHAGSESTSTS